MVDFDNVDTAITSPVKLAHVVLRTKPENFVQMTAFYKTFLGGHSSHENKFLSFITYDEEHHRIAIAAIPGLGDRDARTCGLEVSAAVDDQVKKVETSYSTEDLIADAEI